MNELIKTGYDMLYLSLCALDNVTPDNELVQNLDNDMLFDLCQKHSLTSLVYYALAKVITPEHKWLEANGKAVRKNMLLDLERAKILNFMNENGIKHMPLKGIILKELYPISGMRQMSDNDIWYDESYSKALEQFMQKLGYTDIVVGKGNHDNYKRPPVYNFEMHRTLFNKSQEPFYTYYKDINRLLIRDKNSKYGCHFGTEDFYVYMVAHEYRHYSTGGTGLRSIIDCCVYLKKYGNEMKFTYIETETNKLGISDFEEKQRMLCLKLNRMCFNMLYGYEKEMLEYCFSSCAYGNFENKVNNKLKDFSKDGNITRKSKLKYVLSRIFPPMEFYKNYYPFFYRHKLFLPVCFIIRLYKGIFKSRKKIKREISAINKQK
ncbi:nucleotidyltransferase domain-containing protein [Ruminococcus sp.]|uniref:nucleotidyltransferase domain-containing protein n=1 Tax=Ruminococcus sp. TaxID=41978 RepID=UPI003F1055D9